MAAVGPTVDEFSLTAAVSNSLFSEPSVTPLRKLRKLHISPFFPVESVVETMSNLAGSPVEGISVQCFEDDVVDVCSELEKFLNLRVERGHDFYDKLKRIDISVTALDDTRTFTEQETEERIAAARRLQSYCDDLQLASIVDKLNAEGSASSSGPKSKDSKRARSLTFWRGLQYWLIIIHHGFFLGFIYAYQPTNFTVKQLNICIHIITNTIALTSSWSFISRKEILLMTACLWLDGNYIGGFQLRVGDNVANPWDNFLCWFILNFLCRSYCQWPVLRGFGVA